MQVLAAGSDTGLVGVIGGSGVYSLLDDARTVEVDTPYGPPAAPITVGALAERTVAFLPRHGVDHRFAPHNVPARANLWALRSLGVRQVVSLSAVGSLRAEAGPGTLVRPDQIVDRTSGRPATFTPDGASEAEAVEIIGAAAARHGGGAFVDGGTLVVINGPRFSTRAESLDYQRAGYAIIGMTAMPEGVLARELALCYTTLALVTDLDAGVSAGEGVTHTEVLEQFAANLPRLRAWLTETVRHLPERQLPCEASEVYAGLEPPFELP